MRVRALALLGVGAALAVVPATASAQLPSTTDPRASLAQGLDNAGVAAKGMELLAHVNKAPGWFDPANPGRSRSRNSDIAFQGNYAFFGSFNGFTILNITNPSAPTIQTSVVCPGGQGDVSVYRNLLFMSVEQTTAKKDCGGPTPPATDDDPLPGRPHLRHLEHQRAGAGRSGADLPRLAHAHAGAPEERREQRLHLRVRHRRAAQRQPRSRAATATTRTSRRATNPSKWRIEVIKVPLAAPATASIVSTPRLFAGDDGRGQRPAERGADAEPPVHRDVAERPRRRLPDGRRAAERQLAAGPDHGRLPRHHGLREARPGRRLLRGQRPADRHLRPGQPEAHRRGRRPAVRLLARRDVLQRRQEGLLHRRVGRRHGPALPRDGSAELGRERDLRDRQPQARVQGLLQAAGRADHAGELRQPPPVAGADPEPRRVRAGLVPGRRVARRLHRPDATRRRSATTTAARSRSSRPARR